MKTIIKAAAIIVIIAIMSPISFFIGTTLWGVWHDQWSGYNGSFYVSDGICNIGIANIQGDIMSSPDPEYLSTTPADIRSFIARAESDEYIEGILFEIDSPGGSPAASLAIMEAIRDTALPKAGLIYDYGTSGAYLIASTLDHIIASPFADVGGIGVTMSYLSNVEKNRLEGLEYVSLSSAPFKDYGNPDKELTQEERALLERGLEAFHETFVQIVSENRKLSFEEVAQLANGASVHAELALQQKLIDQIGDRKTARTYFSRVLELPEEEIIFCEPLFVL